VLIGCRWWHYPDT